MPKTFTLELTREQLQYVSDGLDIIKLVHSPMHREAQDSYDEEWLTPDEVDEVSELYARTQTLLGRM